MRQILANIISYYDRYCKIGHTHAMIRGAGNVPCVVVTHSKAHAMTLMGQNRNIKADSLSCLFGGESVALYDTPIVFDNAALQVLCKDTLDLIEKQHDLIQNQKALQQEMQHTAEHQNTLIQKQNEIIKHLRGKLIEAAQLAAASPPPPADEDTAWEEWRRKNPVTQSAKVNAND